MSRLRLHFAAAAALTLSGCAGLTGPAGAPSCDGGSRRPLNRSMWAWENAQPPAGPEASPALRPEKAASSPGSARPFARSDAAESIERSASTTMAPKADRTARFDLVASIRSCTGETRHG